MTKIILTKEYGREYSLFRTVLLNKIVNYDLVSVFAPLSIIGSYAVYYGSGLVYGYHGKSDLENIFRSIGEFSKNTEAVKKLMKETVDIFNWLKPYYDRKKTISKLSDLEDFYNKYRRYFLLQGMIQVLPHADATSTDLKNEALKIREKIQEYNEHAEIVFGETIKSLYPEIGKDWHFLLPDEVWKEEVMSKKVLKEIGARKLGYVLYKENFYAGKDVKKFLDTLGVELEDVSGQQIKEIKGQIAQKGKVTGRVKIVDSFEAINKIGRGDVLVTTMTMPRYLPAMKIAAAFVTDEGGITCHAAIIAREFKKPCIIGTRIATQVLKDGDLVEVDADMGIVRILQK